MQEENNKALVAIEHEKGKEEMNLAEFPIALLSKYHNPNLKTIEFSDTIQGESGKIIKREWVVTGSDKFGLPLAYDNDVLLALMAIGKETNYESPVIHFSRYKILQILGWQDNGKNYRRIKEALNRLVSAKIFANNAFWDNNRKAYVTLAFGIFENYTLLDSSVGKRKQDDNSLLSSVKLDDYLFQSIKSNYIKSLDLEIYCKINSVIAKQLYRYLDKKRYGKEKFEIKLTNLAYAHVGLDKENYKYPSAIKRKLDPAHKELIDLGFLESAEYQLTSDGKSEKVIYTFGKVECLLLPALDIDTGDFNDLQSEEEPAPENNSETLSDELLNLLEKLLDAGVSENIARKLIDDYSEEQILRQMEVLPFRKAQDPAAVLIRAIRENWAPPSTFSRQQEQKKRERANKEKIAKMKSEEEIKRVKIENYISKLSRDEEAKLMDEAKRMAKEEGGIFFKTIEIPEPAIRGYMFQLAEKKLEDISVKKDCFVEDSSQ
jgi:hypothetical protein